MSADKILRQIEFYFGDYNLPRDKFLLEQVSNNQDGWVDLKTIASFSRMKQLTVEIQDIVDSLAQGSSSVVMLNDDRTMVKRVSPLPEDRDELKRTVYIKGFPLDADLDQLLQFLAPHGVGCVRMRRIGNEKAFKGSVFAICESQEKALELAAKEMKWNESSLIALMKEDYLAKKQGTKKRNCDSDQGLSKKEKLDETKEQDQSVEQTIENEEENVELQNVEQITDEQKTEEITQEKIENAEEQVNTENDIKDQECKENTEPNAINVSQKSTVEISASETVQIEE